MYKKLSRKVCWYLSTTIAHTTCLIGLLVVCSFDYLLRLVSFAFVVVAVSVLNWTICLILALNVVDLYDCKFSLSVSLSIRFLFVMKIAF